jgi:hypothetical protein
MVKASRGTAAAKPNANTATVQRKIQKDQDRDDASRPSAKADQKAPVQAGSRKQPENMPAQHIPKPAHESALKLQPRFLAPDYEAVANCSARLHLSRAVTPALGERSRCCLHARAPMYRSSIWASTTTPARRSASSKRKVANAS